TRDAVGEVYGLQIEGDPMSRVPHEGRTARWITAAILREAGVPDARIEAGVDAGGGGGSARGVEAPGSAGTSGRGGRARCRGGAPARTAETSRIAPVTGTPEPIARARMERLGLSGFFPPGQGAFGCEGDERPRLIALARERAGGWPAARAVEVGDTPSDVSGA